MRLSRCPNSRPSPEAHGREGSPLSSCEILSSVTTTHNLQTPGSGPGSRSASRLEAGAPQVFNASPLHSSLFTFTLHTLFKRFRRQSTEYVAFPTGGTFAPIDLGEVHGSGSIRFSFFKSAGSGGCAWCGIDPEPALEARLDRGVRSPCGLRVPFSRRAIMPRQRGAGVHSTGWSASRAAGGEELFLGPAGAGVG